MNSPFDLLMNRIKVISVGGERYNKLPLRIVHVQIYRKVGQLVCVNRAQIHSHRLRCRLKVEDRKDSLGLVGAASKDGVKLTVVLGRYSSSRAIQIKRRVAGSHLQ